MTCPLCGKPIEDAGRLLYPIGSYSNGYSLRQPEHVCSACYLALTPQEASARRALELVSR